MRLANGIVLDKDTTFGELKFSALRREVRIQNEDGSVSDEIKERTYDLKSKGQGRMIQVSIPASVPLKEFDYNARVELINPIADTVATATYQGADVDWYIKPTRCLVEEKQRYLKIQQEDETVYVAYFTINSIVGELDFPSSEIFYYQQQQFTFPIDTSMNVEIVANRKALSTVRNKKKELKDLDNHAWQSDNETSSNVAEALESVNELETNLDQSKESMYKLSYVVRVSANDLDELKRRCNEVKDFYDDLSVKLVRPFGDMLGLHEEFLPASKRYMNDYIQYVTSDFLAGLGFGATQMLGENEGIYVGYSLDTGRNVYLKPALASQGVKGSVTNALASAFVGSLGGGKSFANNLIVYYAVLYGAQAVIVDPKAERGRWKETLPEISHEINIVTLTSDEKNKGLLDPYVIMKNPKDSESLAIDILTFLTGISSRDGERFPILRKAIRAVTNSEVRGLMKVIEELRVENTPLSTSIADHIESFTDYDFAHLLFSNGYVEQSISLEKQLNIIQVADLVLPDKETSFEEYVQLVTQYLVTTEFDDDTVQAIMDEALKYEGWRYVYGGASPTTSFDCSGLTQWTYGKAGINLPRTAQQQYDVTQHIPLSEAQAGDLVFFHSTYNAGSYITHVGIYLGNNRMFHAGDPIGYADLTSPYWQQHLVGAGRIKQ